MKIAIAGYGLEGKSNYRYWNKPGNEITIVDEGNIAAHDLPYGVKPLLGKGVFKHLKGYDLVIRTAGLAPSKLKTDGKVWSSTNEFFEKCPAKIIGITGSKGKGTTASLVASILEAAGKTVWLVGNIGIPALNILDQVKPSDIVVYELSSFQLWDIERSPSTAVVLFIEQEHLDVHKDMREYIDAKQHITRFQTSNDLLIYNGTNKYSTQIALTSKAKKVIYPSSNSAHIRKGNFYYAEQLICSIKALNIIGAHNLDNAIAAIDVIWPLTQDIVAIEKGLESFSGLPHRLKFVSTVSNVRYFDDSIATTPSSTIAALRTFNSPMVVILGGSSKGSDYFELAAELLRHNVKAILIGDEARRIAKLCDEVGFINYEILENASMPVIVKRAHDLAESGTVVLLSPASASFGLFKNYVDRGNQFIEAVTHLDS